MKRTSVTLLGVVLALICLVNAPSGQSLSTYEELPNFHQINAQLYRGAQPKPGGLKKLKELGIKTVLNLRDDDERAVREAEEAKAEGMAYFNIPLERFGKPSEDHIQQVLHLITQPENQPVFVHCRRGKDRTGTVIALYRIERDGWTSEQAEAEAERYGMGFWHVAMKKYIHSYYRRRLKEKGLADPQVQSAKKEKAAVPQPTP